MYGCCRTVGSILSTRSWGITEQCDFRQNVAFSQNLMPEGNQTNFLRFGQLHKRFHDYIQFLHIHRHTLDPWRQPETGKAFEQPQKFNIVDFHSRNGARSAIFKLISDHQYFHFALPIIILRCNVFLAGPEHRGCQYTASGSFYCTKEASEVRQSLFC